MTQFQMKKEKVKSRMILQVCLLSIHQEPSYQKAVDQMQYEMGRLCMSIVLASA